MHLQQNIDELYMWSGVKLLQFNPANVNILYSRKLSREKTFEGENVRGRLVQTRISRRKLLRIAPVQLLCRCGPCACTTHPHTRNVHIADCKISQRKLSRMVLRPRKMRKFSPSKVFHYTVLLLFPGKEPTFTCIRTEH